MTQRCPSCGREIEANARFCPNCGAPVGPGKADAAPGGMRGLRDVLIILGVLAVGAAGYFIFRPGHVARSGGQAEPEMTSQQPQGMTQAGGDQTNPHGTDAMAGVTAAMLDSLPKDFETLVNAGNHYMDQQNFAVAAEAYRRALAMNPQATDVRVDYGACLDGMGLAQRSIEEFRKVLAAEPNHGVALYNMGIVMFKADQPDSAKYYWGKYLKVLPNGPAALQAKQFIKEVDSLKKAGK